MFHSDTALTMTALTAIEKGQEIFNDYGNLPRSDLLRRYGYITDEYRQFDVVEIDTEIVVYIVSAEESIPEKELDKRVN